MTLTLSTFWRVDGLEGSIIVMPPHRDLTLGLFQRTGVWQLAVQWSWARGCRLAHPARGWGHHFWIGHAKSPLLDGACYGGFPLASGRGTLSGDRPAYMEVIRGVWKPLHLNGAPLPRLGTAEGRSWIPGQAARPEKLSHSDPFTFILACTPP